MCCVTFLVILFARIHCYNVEIKVKQGTLVGTRAATVFDRRYYYAFYAVPYAEPPVGDLRFKDPKPLKKWNRPIDARKEYHGACIQAHIVHKHAIYGVEDCLHLNIYTPSLPKDGKTSSKAVVVWIHGYAFSSSFSHVHGGDFFIENDVIFISITHRLGVFGFLKYNETDSNANMGLKDIVIALQWIRKNIKQFDGDKNKITVMASDSAGTYLSLLLLTKSNKLFSKLIFQSGGLYSPSIFQSDTNMEKMKMTREVKKLISKDLMDVSAKDIIKASMKIYNKKDWINFQKPVTPFSPIVEQKSSKSLISVNPYKAFKQFKLKIPVIIGFSSQESITEIIPFLRNPQYLNEFKSFFKFMVPFTEACSYDYTSKKYMEISEKIKQHYFKGVISEHSIQDFLRYVSDVNKYPTYKFIKTLLKATYQQIFVYKFNYVGKFNVMKATSMPDVNVNVKGAAKGDEMCYLMKCEPLWESYANISSKTDDRDKIFTKEIAQLWANFAKTGNPTPRARFDKVTWLPMTLKNDNVLLLSKTSKMVGSKYEENMFTFWNNIYDEYYSPERCTQNKRDEL